MENKTVIALFTLRLRVIHPLKKMLTWEQPFKAKTCQRHKAKTNNRDILNFKYLCK